MLQEALKGDILFVVTPAVLTSAPTALAWTRNVGVTVENAAGEIHEWFDEAIATGVSIGDTSTAGTASIDSTTLTFVAGKATVVVDGDAAAWLAAETVTVTVAAFTAFAGQTMALKTSVDTYT
jgi:hypothetical protein